MDYYIGMDIGGTKCAVLLATVDHGIVFHDAVRFATEASRGFSPVFDALCAGAETLLARNKIPKKSVRAIGVSCGGPLDSRRGLVLSPPNLPGWDDIPLAALLRERFGVPAYLMNDANACALVEWRLGAGRGTRDMIFLTMGTGMGAGVIAEGRLVRGHTDMGGEVGHLRLTEDGPVGFGKAGSFEGYTSGGGIARQAAALTERLIAQGRAPAWSADGLQPEDMTAKRMAEYAKSGDKDALQFFEHIGDMLGRGLALLCDAFNPERIVIGSIFVRCEALLRSAMERALSREAIGHALRGFTVCKAQTGELLGDYASIMAALYSLNIDPMQAGNEQDARVLEQYERLFSRYPALNGCRTSVMDAYLLLRDCYGRGGKFLLCGNGGSCADCEHIVGELMKGFYLKRPLPQSAKARIAEAMGNDDQNAADKLQRAIPAIALTEHTALSTAIQNDVDASLCYAQQVIGYGRKGDVLLCISTSGNARNVLLAAKTAAALGLDTLALTGGDGGALAKRCGLAIIAPGNSPADVQEAHLPIYHTLCAMLESKFFGGNEACDCFPEEAENIYKK